MKIPQYKTKLSMMIIFSSIVLVILSMASIYYFHTGDEASVGVFSLAVTLIGTIFIAVELKNGQDVKKTGTKYDGLTRNLLEFKVKS